MNCIKCNRKIPKATAAEIGDSEGGETEIKIVCPHCDVKLYAFVRDRQVAREDHALELAAQIHATEDGVSTVVGTFGPSGIISSKVATPTNKRNKP